MLRNFKYEHFETMKVKNPNVLNIKKSIMNILKNLNIFKI
jgi:hypothetical protein